MKRPLTLLVGIVLSIILLSILFPSDPTKPDILSKIKSKENKPPVVEETVKKYRISDILKLEDIGNALAWTLDEKYLYYTKPVEGEDGSVSEEIWFSNLEGNKQKVDIELKLTGIRNAKWSEDGSMMAFIANIEENKSGLFIYDKNKNTLLDITPKKFSDIGVISYDWDRKSQNIVMSVDIVGSSIYIYNLKNQKTSKLAIQLKSCRDVAFYDNEKIIFSNMDENLKYRIYTSDMSGENIKFVVEGQNFILSPNKKKMAITTDGDSQNGLWVYNIESKVMKSINSLPMHNVYWLGNDNLLYSTEVDARLKYAYEGVIYFVEKNMEITDITGAVHTIFTPSKSGKYIGMTSPEDMEDSKGNQGVFIGQLYR